MLLCVYKQLQVNHSSLHSNRFIEYKFASDKKKVNIVVKYRTTIILEGLY